MTNLVNQMRNLADRLSAINEEDDVSDFPKFPTLKIGDIDPRNGQKILSAATDGSGNVIRSRFGDIYNVKYGPADVPTPPKPDPVVIPEPPKPDPVVIPEPPKPDPVVIPEPPKPDPVVIPEPPVPDIIAPMPTPDEPCGPELKAKLRLMPSFNKAYAAAKQGGCSDFEWCQIITVPETTPQTAQGWEAHSGQNTGGGAAVGNPNITAQGRKSGATQAPNVPFQKATGYTPSPEEAQAIIDNGQSNDIQRYGGLDALKKIAGQQTVKEDELARWRKIAGLKEADTAGLPTIGNDLPEIKASSKSAAIDQARKKGIKRFRWCSMYKVTDNKTKKKLPNIAPMPKQDRKKVDFTGQETPLGGTMDNPMSFAANSNFGA